MTVTGAFVSSSKKNPHSFSLSDGNEAQLMKELEESCTQGRSFSAWINHTVNIDDSPYTPENKHGT